MIQAQQSKFHVASEEQIKAGKTTDVYFLRTEKIINKYKLYQKVTAEIHTKSLPQGAAWGILAGVEEALNLLEGLPIEVENFTEGTFFEPLQPVLTIRGRYIDFARFETALLGCLCQASGIATKAAQFRLAAKNKILLSFGARRMHPVIAPMIERNAYLGGCDGVASVAGAELLGLTPSGTIPHALVIMVGNSLEAVKAFDATIEEDIPRIALVDTFDDEKSETLRIVEAMGNKLNGIRLDTPYSRRGNMREIVQELRWELDLRGFQQIKIFVSGGVDLKQIHDLVDYADGFGVGTSLSNAPVIDFALDIVEVEGKPISKRGKRSGSKKVVRCLQNYHTQTLPADKATPALCFCKSKVKNLLEPSLKNGQILKPHPSPDQIRHYVLEQLQILKLDNKE